MARIIARFGEDVPRVGGQGVEMGDDGLLYLEGTRTRVVEEQVEAAVRAGLASWEGVPPDAAPAADDGTGDTRRGKGHGAIRPSRRALTGLAAVALLVAAAAAGWFAYPLILGTGVTDGSASESGGVGSVAGGTVSGTEDAESTEDTGSPESTGSVAGSSGTGVDAEPGPGPTTSALPVTIEGYLRGYDTGSPDAGLLLVYDADGNLTPVLYDPQTEFRVGGEAVSLDRFVRMSVAAEGQPVRLVRFEVREASDADRHSIPGSSTVDPSTVTLYLIRALGR